MKKKKFTTFLPVALIAFCLLFIFIHSTPQRLIRADLFFKHHFIGAFQTQIKESSIIDTQYGSRYYCENPSIGPDYYDINFKFIGKLKFWYIYWPGTGGG
jgi:hypothetical protein